MKLDRYSAAIRLILLVALVVPGPGIAQQSATSYRVVTDERLKEPEAENWLFYRGTYNGWGYSSLEQINSENVGSLVPVWAFSTGVNGGHEAVPIVNDGIMFVTTPGNQVIAIDGRTGDLLWLYQHELAEDAIAYHYTIVVSRCMGIRSLRLRSMRRLSLLMRPVVKWSGMLL